MLKDVNWSEDGTYRPGELNSPEKFFNDCLRNSNEFDLQLGYFSSATISVLADGFASFISNGGKMRLIINQIVSEEDKEAISNGIYGNIINCFDLSNFEELRETFDEYQKQFFDCLAYLINNHRIDIRIIRPKNTNGIAHVKSGQFRDGDSTTSFTGSANFTISGLFNNLEEIKIDRSNSVDTMVQNRIKGQLQEFENIMAGTKDNIEYLSPEQLEAAIKSIYTNKDIEELLDVEAKLHLLKRNKLYDYNLKDKNYINDSFEDLKPEFPYASGPRDYQMTAFYNWKTNNQKGLFAMATGTGKTITSLNCLLEIYKSKRYYKAIILVPTITLVNQWEQECLKFRFNNVIKVYSKSKQWENDIQRIKRREMYHYSTSEECFVIISTYASFARENVFNLLNSFSKKQVLLIADEAHNMGSGSILKKLKDIVYLRRIGLSATPERQFDDETNSKIFEFFGVKEHYTYEYSMKEAIENGVLCRYYYYPHLVKLNQYEMDEYVILSKKIAKYFNFNEGIFSNKKDDVLMRLLLQRKRIIHKAENKMQAFKNIINERFSERKNLKYTLVYVPEGIKPDYEDADIFVNDENIQDDDFSEHLINEYTMAITELNKYITVKEFMSNTKDREETLKDFATGKLQVLTSMKCLDEGIDVPRSEMAIFCSSTGNPRQFIQRRGRVLRTHPDKHMAILHDLVVIPEISSISDTYQMEKSLLKGEIERVKNFALLSENPSFAQYELLDIMNHYGLNMFNNDNI